MVASWCRQYSGTIWMGTDLSPSLHILQHCSGTNLTNSRNDVVVKSLCDNKHFIVFSLACFYLKPWSQLLLWMAQFLFLIKKRQKKEWKKMQYLITFGSGSSMMFIIISKLSKYEILIKLWENVDAYKSSQKA